MKQTDSGILLHRISYSETSLITTFYTQQHGIQKFIFQGGKKKSGNLTPLGIYELTFYRRPDSELGKLNQVELLEPMHAIFASPIKQVIAFFLADILHQSLKTDLADEPLFQYLVASINKLNQDSNPQFFPATFLLTYIIHLGISPLIEERDANYFDIQQGIFTNSPRNMVSTLQSEAAHLIRDYMEGFEIPEIAFKKQTKEIVLILVTYLSFHVPNFKGEKCLSLAKEIMS
jgi:DNA repair protein RecO (recombination protein O)